MMYDAAALTDDQLRKLAALHNRSTRYEVVAINGRFTVLIGYTIHKSRHGLLSTCRNIGQKVIDGLALSDTDMMIPAKKAGEGFTLGTWSVRFSGRTQREAIMEGERVYVGDIGKAVAA